MAKNERQEKAELACFFIIYFLLHPKSTAARISDFPGYEKTSNFLPIKGKEALVVGFGGGGTKPESKLLPVIY